MRLNSSQAVQLGRALVRYYGGDWSAVHRASKPGPNGALLVEPGADFRPPEKAADKKA